MWKPEQPSQWVLGRFCGDLRLTHLPTGAQIYAADGMLVHELTHELTQKTIIHDLEAHDTPEAALMRLARELNARWVGVPDPQWEPAGR